MNTVFKFLDVVFAGMFLAGYYILMVGLIGVLVWGIWEVSHAPKFVPGQLEMCYYEMCGDGYANQ